MQWQKEFMKILYIAKHGQQNNDDEGSIYKALTLLGHQVERFQLSDFQDDHPMLDLVSSDYDFALFHKLPSTNYIEYVCDRWKGVCWYFDAIDKGFISNDEYADTVQQFCHTGFFTDGDFVISKNKDNIKLLRQGLDDIDIEHQQTTKPSIDFVFIGTIGHGGYGARQEYLTNLISDFEGWGPHTEYSIFKNDLTSVCQQAKIMLGMPPSTDNYWSNRVYLLAGRGAFVLHPYAKELENQFGDSLAFYNNYDELKYKIEYYIAHDQERIEMSNKARDIVLDGHCYVNRCMELIKEI